MLLIGTMVGLVAAEALVRVTHGARYADRPTFYPSDSLLGWSPAPDLDHTYYGDDYSITVATDEGGYRLGQLGRVPDGAERVLLVGDSYTFGWGVSTPDSYASRLDEALAPTSMRAVNVGVGGYGTMQSSLRLERYLQEHPSQPVSAIVLLHSHNDPSDNVTFATVQRGLRQYVEGPRNRGLHLQNLVRLVKRATTNPDDASAHTLPGGYRDFLWTVGAFETDAGQQVGRSDDPLPGSDEELMWPAQEVLPTYERESLTRLQSDLLRESIARINQLGIERGALVIHTTIHSAPMWYVEPIRQLVEETAPGNEQVSWCGRVPADQEYVGPVENDHSGSHYTPELNGYYAEKIAMWLARGGCG